MQSVDRAARVLLACGELDEPRTVGELAVELGVHKSTASRLVATLVGHELLEASGRPVARSVTRSSVAMLPARIGL